VGKGRIKSKNIYPRPQKEVEDNEYHRMIKRYSRYEEVAFRVEISADAET
jgi:hypothetical protein